MKKLIESKRTGKWFIENYPASSRTTYSYLHELIEDTFQEKKGKILVFSVKTRFGKAYYLHEMSKAQYALFNIAGIAMNTLISSLKE